jgi:hypothetical protein
VGCGVSAIERWITGAIVGGVSMALVLSLDGTFWTGLWLGILINICIGALTTGQPR